MKTIQQIKKDNLVDDELYDIEAIIIEASKQAFYQARIDKIDKDDMINRSYKHRSFDDYLKEIDK